MSTRGRQAAGFNGALARAQRPWPGVTRAVAGRTSCAGLLLAALAILGAASCSRQGPGAGEIRQLLARAGVDRLDQPLILADLPVLGTAATLLPAGSNGDVVTWQAAGGAQISLEQGVVVATRGLGFDLMSADASATVARLSGPPEGGTYERFASYLDGENKTVFLAMVCRMQPGGREVLPILTSRYEVQRIEETCALPDATMTNDYWRQSDGTIRKSRQWVGPGVGYVEIELLADGR
ncbi:YjbF family lipoprotein [Histidinibacterium lentulum]|uniref:YjbF family lipoprotein n=1 Tax=Histidinibacterium lentulum TaxID=2480588 RepID=A0A3N2QS98_9RHOB|nr:YjbF family lipoprotein [Histidinibacterium lentulum]ROT98092.1 hypothetical protein EAT49_17645 [Histidinibacterium lentulum]